MRLEILLCDNVLRRQRHTAYASILAAERRVRVRMSEVAELDFCFLRTIVRTAVMRLKDEEMFVTGAALVVLRHVIE